GIGAGKSAVAARLAELGAVVIDADAVAREVVEPGTPALAAIAERFGPDVLTADGALDRAAMRARIGADPEARAALERITHPAIGAEILHRVAANADAPVVVVEAALLVETGSWRLYPELVVVTTTPELQRARVLARDGSDALIAAQLPLAEKERHATWLIRNDGTLAELEAQVDALWETLSRTRRAT
nr:dephospho-CoA kinase [Deltaproteobacteria bacterium]